MKKALSSVLVAYRRYKTAKANSRAYRILRYLLLSIVITYVLLLSFPQVLFAHEISYRNLKVYSREPLDQNIYVVLDRVESRLATSEISNQEVKPKIFLTNGFGSYEFLSLYLGSNSFGKGYAVLPTNNIFINKSDLAKDLVFRNSAANNQRSLSDVIAHEATHLLITGYQYFKYYMLVKYLLEHDKLSVDDLFNRDFDKPSLEERVLNAL